MTLNRLLTTIVLVSVGLSLGSCVSGPPPTQAKFLYVALGASDATGVGAFPLTKGYVYLIRNAVEKFKPGVSLLNLGVPGERIGPIKETVRVAVVQVGLKPNLVTLWTGANDLIAGDDPREFQADLRFILQNLRKTTAAVIVVANLPDLTKLPRFRDQPSPIVTLDRVRAFNKGIAQEAAAVNAPVVDLFAEPVSDNLVSDLDGFHPNKEGHREIAVLFLEVLLPKVGER
jgi:lysophospholipase L1-like esterase